MQDLQFDVSWLCISWLFTNYCVQLTFYLGGSFSPIYWQRFFLLFFFVTDFLYLTESFCFQKDISHIFAHLNLRLTLSALQLILTNSIYTLRVYTRVFVISQNNLILAATRFLLSFNQKNEILLGGMVKIVQFESAQEPWIFHLNNMGKNQVFVESWPWAVEVLRFGWNFAHWF